MSKIIRDCIGFALLCSVIGLEISHHFFNQSDEKLKPITTCLLAFSALDAIYLYLLWVLIGSLEYFPLFWLAVVITLVLWHLIKKCSIYKYVITVCVAFCKCNVFRPAQRTYFLTLLVFLKRRKLGNPEINPGPEQWEASALTTAPTLLPTLLRITGIRLPWLSTKWTPAKTDTWHQYLGVIFRESWLCLNYVTGQ